MSTPFDELATKSLGSVTSRGAALDGLSGVFRKLAQEHGELTALFLRLRMSSSAQVRGELFPLVRDELLAHERAEVAVVYAALARYDETHWLALQHRREAVRLERLIARVAELPYDDPAWSCTLAALADAVQLHTAEEEDELFPTAQRIVGADTSHALRARYELTKTTM